MTAVRGLLCLFCVVMATEINSSDSSADQHQLELKQHYDHVHYVSQFSCSTPQPKIVPVREIFSPEYLHGKAFFPEYTVLHHCAAYSTCCPSGHQCHPSTTEKLSLPFKITFLEDMEEHKQGAWMIDYHELLNHTECACVENPVLTPFCADVKNHCTTLESTCSNLQKTCPE